MGVAASLLGGAALSGAAGIGSSIMTNNANKDIAQNNNAFNEKMLQKQMDYNKEMYKMQLGDTYQFMEDQASLQARGFEKAGFNPGVMMSGNLGSVSAPTAQGINPPSASSYSADYSSIGQSIASAIGMYNELQNSRSVRAKMDAETEQVHIENKYSADLLAANLAKMKAETRSIDTKRELDAILKHFAPARQNAELALLNAQTKSQLEQAKVASAEVLMFNKQLSWIDAEKRQQLAESAARISLMYQQGRLTREQVKKTIQETAESVARTSYTNTQNRIGETDAYVAENTKQNRVDIVEQELWRAINNSGSDSFLQYFQMGRDNRTFTPGSGKYPLQPVR